jgi:class 3 adenylate cyclase
MFSDLVGSTALSARMDPEDLREVISAYQKCVAETVKRFGGFVAKYMGDGVLIYFGYPGPPGRCRASRACGAGVSGRCGLAQNARDARNARRHRHGARSRRRPEVSTSHHCPH